MGYDFKTHIRTIPDFPKPGIQFRDVTTLFAHPQALAYSVEALAAMFRETAPDMVAGLEARGFVLGGAVATALGAGFVPMRKPGKLPSASISESYTLEYGEAALEVHVDAFLEGHRVLIIDDLIATGGTGLAGVKLARRLGAEVVGFGAVIDLPELGGAQRIRDAGVRVEALVAYEGH
ncbi:MAG: adenine phosphoribosyltransferase [Neomegalonema sp.]|nr:adenine phosphoribosyltransferase [Neomegalonema sp.]